MKNPSRRRDEIRSNFQYKHKRVKARAIEAPPVMLQRAQVQRSRSVTRSSRTTSGKPPTRAHLQTKRRKHSHARQGASRRTSHPRPSTQLKHALRQEGLRCLGRDSGIVKSHIHVYYIVVMYTYKKCYVGFCTPRCTVMDSKKEKKKKEKKIPTRFFLLLFKAALYVNLTRKRCSTRCPPEMTGVRNPHHRGH